MKKKLIIMILTTAMVFVAGAGLAGPLEEAAKSGKYYMDIDQLRWRAKQFVRDDAGTSEYYASGYAIGYVAGVVDSVAGAMLNDGGEQLPIDEIEAAKILQLAFVYAGIAEDENFPAWAVVWMVLMREYPEYFSSWID